MKGEIGWGSSMLLSFANYLIIIWLKLMEQNAIFRKLVLFAMSIKKTG